MNDVHVHVRRVVVDAGAEAIDGPTLPAALESALSSRLDPRGAERPPDATPSTTDLIADAIASHVAPVSRGDGGGHA